MGKTNTDIIMKTYDVLLLLGNATTVQKTKNPADIQRWLGQIQVHGGFDCPEFSLTGIQAGMSFTRQRRRLLLPFKQRYVCFCFQV